MGTVGFTLSPRVYVSAADFLLSDVDLSGATADELACLIREALAGGWEYSLATV